MINNSIGTVKAYHMVTVPLIAMSFFAYHQQDSDPDHSVMKKPASKQPFLRRGEGIARFGLKGARVKLKKKPHQQKDQLAQVHNIKGKSLRSMSSPLLNSNQGVVMSPAGILAGQNGSEVRGAGNGNKHVCEISCVQPRISTPMSLVRCSSDDSFIIRRDNRLKVHHVVPPVS